MSYPKIDLTAAARLAQGLQDYLGPDEVAKAISRGLNKAAIGIRAELVKRVGQDVNLKASRMKAIAPIQKSNLDTLEARIIVKGESIPLIDFVTNLSELKAKATHVKEGEKRLKPVKIKIQRKGKVKELRTGFLAPTYHNIMKRDGPERGPLTMLHGPSLSSFASKIQEEMEPLSREIVEKRIGESLSYQIKKSLGVI